MQSVGGSFRKEASPELLSVRSEGNAAQVQRQLLFDFRYPTGSKIKDFRIIVHLQQNFGSFFG